MIDVSKSQFSTLGEFVRGTNVVEDMLGVTVAWVVEAETMRSGFGVMGHGPQSLVGETPSSLEALPYNYGPP